MHWIETRDETMDQRRNVLIIQGHPDPSETHLCHALADQYASGAREAGFNFRALSIATLGFPILRNKQEFDATPLPLERARDAIRLADHIVLFFPLWLGTMPALMKAFFEQLLRPVWPSHFATRDFRPGCFPDVRRMSLSRWECRPGSTA